VEQPLANTSLPYMVLDVFTDRTFVGNPLAVVFESDSLSDAHMVQIAREFGYSETTFILLPRKREAAWRLRSFTTNMEVFGAGHNALGAWWALAATGRVKLDQSSNVFYQELGNDILPVEVHSTEGSPITIFMRQKRAVFGEAVATFDVLAKAFGLPQKAFEVPGLRPTPVSTGARHLMIPIIDLSALRAVTIHSDALAAVTKSTNCGGCYLFTLETLESTSAAHARFFAPAMGDREDPATGSAAGPLAAYLQAGDVVRGTKEIVVEQGDEVGRPGRIHVRLQEGEVLVGGRSFVVAEGKILTA
jgi:trans-2,3-dihydro-3-hydroxyanthranilate isomerase